MNPGKLHDLITIQYNASSTKNDGGEIVDDWKTYITLWAEFSYKPGVEVTEADQLVGITNVDIKTRLNTGVKQAMRVKDASNNYYDIVGVQHLDRMYMILKCFMRDNSNV